MKSTHSMQNTAIIYCVTELKASLFGALPQVLHPHQTVTFVVVLGLVSLGKHSEPGSCMQKADYRIL